jgi:hypothetical protein
MRVYKVLDPKRHQGVTLDVYGVIKPKRARI